MCVNYQRVDANVRFALKEEMLWNTHKNMAGFSHFGKGIVHEIDAGVVETSGCGTGVHSMAGVVDGVGVHDCRLARSESLIRHDGEWTNSGR